MDPLDDGALADRITALARELRASGLTPAEVDDYFHRMLCPDCSAEIDAAVAAVTGPVLLARRLAALLQAAGYDVPADLRRAGRLRPRRGSVGRCDRVTPGHGRSEDPRC